jgi:hypothetical protein
MGGILMNHLNTCKPHQPNDHRRKGQTSAGLVLAMIGLIWFAKLAGWIQVASGMSLLWPALVLALGIFLIVVPGRGRSNRSGIHQ